MVILFMTAVMPAIISITSLGHYTGNNTYYGFNEAVSAAPLWFYVTPVFIGGIAIFLILRKPVR